MATEFFIDPVAGSDTDNGLTRGTAFATRAKAETAMVAGDTTTLMDGKLLGNFTPTLAGSAGLPITWRADNPHLHEWERMTLGNGDSYINFEDIRMVGDGSSTATIQATGDAANLHHINFDNLDIFKALRRGINVNLSGDATLLSSYPDEIHILNCTFDECHGCVTLMAQNSSIDGNTMRNMFNHGTGGDVNYCTVHGNLITINGNTMQGTLQTNTGSKHVDCVQSFNNGTPKYIKNITITNNMMEVTHQGILVQNNVVSPSVQMENFTIKNNVFFDFGSGGANLQGIVLEGIKGIDVDHNTFIWKAGSARFAYGVRDSSGEFSTGTIKNGAIFGGKVYSNDGSLAVVNSNNISSNGTNAESTDFNAGVSTDPELIDVSDPYNSSGDGLWHSATAGWRPDVGSPCIGNATDGGDIGCEIAIDGTPPPADTTPPVITRLGAPTINVDQGGAYVDPGATAIDNVDGDVTGSIVVFNPVNTSVPAIYTVTYDVDDAAGNSATQVTRTVEVHATPPSYVIQAVVTINKVADAA